MPPRTDTSIDHDTPAMRDSTPRSTGMPSPLPVRARAADSPRQDSENSPSGYDAPEPDRRDPGAPWPGMRTVVHWTPERKRTFLEALARCGNVRGSAGYAGMSHEAAYQLRRRDPAFACAWDGALMIARDVAQDMLAEHALNGITEDIVYHGEVTASRTRFDGRLLLALLGRLDRHAEHFPARRGAARFDALLDRIAQDADASDLVDTPLREELPFMDMDEAQEWEAVLDGET